MKIASWNVNSIRARLPHLEAWLASSQPDIALLQETKVSDDAFPFEAFESTPYNVAIHGQKNFNGVAILSKYPMDVIAKAVPGETSDEARWLEVAIQANGQHYRIASAYVPNGNPIDGPKFDKKIQWLQALCDYTRDILASEERLIIGGDYNILDLDDDCDNIEDWRDDALAHPRSQALFRQIVFQGFTDALRVHNRGPGVYSYWDYRRGAWAKNQGLLIDRFLLSPLAANELRQSGVDKEQRDKPKASDHAPVWCVLES